MYYETYLVSESTGREASSDRRSAGVRSELEHGALAEGTRRDHEHVGGILDRHHRACRQHQLLPCAPQVDHVGTVRTTLVNVRLHLRISHQVLELVVPLNVVQLS